VRVKPEIPPDLAALANKWDDLNGEGRRQVGRSLRRLGLTYEEIRELIPVPKSTLAGWSRNVVLTSEQLVAMRLRTGGQGGIPRDTQRKRRAEIGEIQRSSRTEAVTLISDPLWIAGTTMYWAEGNKTQRSLAMANTDEDVLRLFVAWVHRFHDRDADFSLMLHLHEGNDDAAARSHWAHALHLPDANWHKTFMKPSGTGHRKNRLPWGVCRVNVRRSADAFIRTMAWIDVLRCFDDGNPGVWPTATISPGR